MFNLTVIKEAVKLHPARLRHDFDGAVVEALNQKYCNKVIPRVGLCIAVFDLLETDDPMVHQGEAFAHVKVTFRAIIFRPILGEVLVGRIRNCSEEGVHVTLGFFDDILIPPNSLQPDTQFDTNEQVWIWNYGDNSKLYMDNGESIRFRLFREHFEESAPIPKETLMMARVAASAAGHDAEESSKPPILTTPYRLYGSVAEDGLGVTSWWGSNE